MTQTLLPGSRPPAEPASDRRAGPLGRVAGWAYRRRGTTLLLWLAAVALAFGLSSTFADDFSADYSVPGSDSRTAQQLLQDRFPAQAGDTIGVVVRAEDGVATPAAKDRIQDLLGQMADVPHVKTVVDPFTAPGSVSPDGRTAVAKLRLDVSNPVDMPHADTHRLLGLAEQAEGRGMAVALDGQAVQQAEQGEIGSEAIGFAAAAVILLITFGSVIAMGLPIASALFGIAIGLSLVMLLANFLSVPEFTPQLASMIGIGVGIDYALFIVTRYRQQLHHGLDPEQATMVAITTSGKAVLFAGTTVVISLLGILLMGFEFVEGLAVGGAATVAVTMMASVTLLPALLGFVGEKIDRLRLPMFHQDESKFEHSLAYRWSRVIQRFPWPAAIAGLAVLLLMSIPLFSIRLGFADASAGGTDRSSRRAYDLISEGFGPGFNGPLLLATEVESPDDIAELEAVGQSLTDSGRVAAATPALPNEDGNAAVLIAYPLTPPQDEATTKLVERIRSDVIPEATGGQDSGIHVGGFTAAIVDFSEANADRLPILLAVVIGLSFILLVAVFRSVVVPLKAAIMNLLSIGAAYGAVVAIFQWGWLKDLVGIETSGPIEAWAPMMMFAILFGLSMDYEIFLLSRIREEYLRTGKNKLAVANGLATTARVITAAAAIMVTLFLVFVFGFEERAIKLFAIGLAVAIFVDATVVRMVLVPATMELLGDLNWWLPKWLGRILPKIEIEGEEEVVSHVLEETGGLHVDEVPEQERTEPEPV